MLVNDGFEDEKPVFRATKEQVHIKAIAIAYAAVIDIARLYQASETPRGNTNNFIPHLERMNPSNTRNFETYKAKMNSSDIHALGPLSHST